MAERDWAKGVANKSNWLTLRNDVTELNKKKKKLDYEAKINDINFGGH
jgi:hypothetical protein